jgi:hypothetical protein
MKPLPNVYRELGYALLRGLRWVVVILAVLALLAALLAAIFGGT